MTREELKQIYHLEKELEMWKEELTKLEYERLACQKITGMPFGSGTSNKTMDLAIRICDIMDCISNKREEIYILRKKIIDFINGIEDSYIRQIVTYRNIRLMRWEEIADTMKTTSTSIKKTYYRYLDNLGE